MQNYLKPQPPRRRRRARRIGSFMMQVLFGSSCLIYGCLVALCTIPKTTMGETMKSNRSLYLGVFVFLLTACSATIQPIHDYQSLPIPYSGRVSLSTIESDILVSATKAGWIAETRKNGHIVARLNKDSQQAEVDIFFSEKTFSVLYRDSINLQKDGRMISSDYNQRVDQLVSVIKRRFQLQRSE